MVFSNLAFIFRKLPIFMTADFALEKYCYLRNFSLVAISLIFYCYDNQNTIFVLFCGLINYIFIHILFMHNSRGGYDTNKIIILIVVVVLNLVGLCYYKYSYCLSSLIPLNLSSVQAIPLGISLFTLLTIIILAVIHTNRINQKPTVRQFSTYFFIFPQLVAKPMVRFKHVQEKLKQRKYKFSKVSYGMCV